MYENKGNILDNNCFDFIRMVLAINIVMQHLATLSQNTTLSVLNQFSNSDIAVKGFFVISGFLVSKSYINTKSIKEYYIKRARRILPAYIFIILFVSILFSIFSSLDVTDYFSNINLYKYIGWNLIFLNFVSPCLPGLFENNLLCAVNGSLWTLKIEESFYLILPIIFYFIKKLNNANLFLGIIYIFSTIYWYVLTYQFYNPLLAKQLPGSLMFFSVGIFLYSNIHNVLKFKNVLLFCSLSFIIINYYGNNFLELFFPIIIGIFIITAAYTFTFFKNFGKYGDFTYGVYISHFPIIQLFKHYNLFDKYNPFLMSFFVATLTFIFAVFSWFAIEKRFLHRYTKYN